MRERIALRQEKASPLLAELRQRLLTCKKQLLPRHPMAEAIHYALDQRDELMVFCMDGGDPRDLKQYLSPTRHRPARVFDATARELTRARLSSIS